MALAISPLEKTPLLVRAAAFWHWLGYWWGESQGIQGKEEGTDEQGLYPSQGVWFSPWGQWGASDSLWIYFTVSDSQKRSGGLLDQGPWIRTQQGPGWPWMRGQRARKWPDSIPTGGETEAHSVCETYPGRLSSWEVGAQMPCFSVLWPTWPRLPAPKDRRTPLSCLQVCGFLDMELNTRAGITWGFIILDHGAFPAALSYYLSKIILLRLIILNCLYVLLFHLII